MTTETARGFWLALSSYALWGLFPIYFYGLRDVSPGEVLVHRVVCEVDPESWTGV